MFGFLNGYTLEFQGNLSFLLIKSLSLVRWNKNCTCVVGVEVACLGSDLYSVNWWMLFQNRTMTLFPLSGGFFIPFPLRRPNGKRDSSSGSHAVSEYKQLPQSGRPVS